MTDIITKNKVVLKFRKEVTENKILQSIAVVVQGELKKELKKFTVEELNSLLEIEKILFKIDKNLIPKYNNLDAKKYD
ncbi:hypothetical protein [Spiroplasma kunkelii]|uniref:hypothetical protein n=1 Tax=Spiroplasma kunkelii TaxID=47834 RepID=UPI0006A9BE0E|nr:hypothetical protein [Spiroplasma kunkelii]